MVAWLAAGVFSLPAAVGAQPPSPRTLQTVKGMKCSFPVMVNGTWSNQLPGAAVKSTTLSLQFGSINTDEGTAKVTGGFGYFDITVRLSGATLHFMQSFRDGPLYITTVFAAESRDGKLKAVHTRHELTAIVLPGFTSSPEQYYGECEAE